ncbi:MAG: YCF48-related protein [Xanthomonadales bacterium]|nr:YCF48-related protein [Xanthomonadales bacterium]
MTRKHQLLALLCTLFFSSHHALANGASDLDVEYAEHMPLVGESMLLDITRAGNTLVTVGERGHVLFSTDGKNWTQAEVVPTRSTLTTVTSSGGRLWAGGHDSVIITSGDGGNTWTRQFYDAERQQSVMDLYFTDEDNGVAIGSYGLYLKTEDGGQNWEDIEIDPDGGYHLNAMIRLDDGRRLIAGEAGYSYRSHDDGETWEMLDMPYMGSMWGALRLEGECVLFYGLRGHAMESCDFGTSWKEYDTGTEASISGGAYNDGLVLLAANSGMVLTHDDGEEWRARQHSSGVDFAAVIAQDDGTFLLVGEDGVFEFPETAAEGNSDD